MKIRNVLTWILMLVILIGMLLPLWWMLLGTFSESFASGSLLRNLTEYRFTLENLSSILKVSGFSRSILNSLVVGGIVTVGNLVFCLMVGYAFARFKLKFNKLLFLSVAAVLMIPVHIIIIPLFLLIKGLGWYDSYFALIVPFLVNPLAVLLITQYIRELPPDLEEAARIDGAGELRILFSVVAPMCKPVLAVLAVQVFMTNWNSFLLPFILTSSETMRTLPVMLALLQGYQQIDWPQLFAASTISAIPVIAVFLLFQRQIVSGITAGAVKS
ncbi:MAG: carbohydrate ABC transporter permease [candidate division Zixibacteria bacterium]|nr:carbohydrate ABC transporter permease [candidate division Zixibacteria bacterium]MBU1470963.1 carbohydrate ABC transporter permease [candidate division Zixibacteria bacterium]MBU2625543.1 carbohydrate ABC transporter permease [candidate division Zixibacteria bacterium]